MEYQAAIDHILNKLAKDLPPHLTYHGHHHTIDVLEAAKRIAIAENVSEADLNLLLVAAAYHDCGFLFGHQNHEERGCEVARDILPKFGFEKSSIEQICRMIMATKVPQQPLDDLSKILCDADLDYLGRDDFEPIGSTLFSELKELGILHEVEVWNRIQLKFLEQHSYHTDYGKSHRQSKKKQHLEKIRSIVEGYDK